MLKGLRGAAATIPFVGPVLKRVYLKLVEGEGSVRPITGGPLEGMKYYHYRWSTPRADLVQTNWDDASAAALAKLMKGKRRFYDVGANWGFFVLLAQKHRDPGCQVIAFEPHPRTVAELETQIKLNGIANATVVAAAVSDQVGKLDLFDTGSAIGQTLDSIEHSHHGQGVKITVDSTTLDVAADKYGPPDLLKIDVEGAENLVLDGGKTVFTKYRPEMLVELHGTECSRRLYEQAEAYGYRCETLAGEPITDRAFHQQIICRPI